MKVNQTNILFALAIVLVVLVALFQIKTVNKVENPSYDAYYGIKQVKSIHETGMPIVFDKLSYQGRVNISQVVFNYLAALFTLIIPVVLFFKYASIFLWIIVIFLIYLISNKLFSNKVIVFLLTFFAILSPIILTAHLNTFEPSIVFAIIFLLILNLFFNLEKKSSIITFIILILISTFVSSLSLILVLGFLMYLLLMKISSKKIIHKEKELIIFTGVFIVWLHFIIYRKLFLSHGISLFQASIPTELLLRSFYGLSIPLALSLVGIIPLILGINGVYVALFRNPTKKNLLIVSFLFSFIMALLAGLISFAQGFLFITILLVLLSGISLKQINGFLNRTVVERAKMILVIIAIILISLNFIPMIGYSEVLKHNSPDGNELQTMKFINENTPLDATILATIQEGHLIASEAKRKNFFDTNFIFAPQANQRYIDAKSMFLSKSESNILNQMNYYNIDYIYESPQTQITYPRTSDTFQEIKCFQTIFETNTTRLYKQICNK